MIWERILQALGAGSYYAHAICLTNDPVIISLYLLGDLAIWASYMVIGLSLAILYTGTMRLSRTATVLFGAFIFLCGMTHLTKSMTLFFGVYFLDLAVVLMTATVSGMTAVFTAREATAAWKRN